MALEPTEQRGELVPAISARALRRAAEVPFYRPERHAHLLSDPAVGPALGDQCDDFPLT